MPSEEQLIENKRNRSEKKSMDKADTSSRQLLIHGLISLPAATGIVDLDPTIDTSLEVACVGCKVLPRYKGLGRCVSTESLQCVQKLGGDWLWNAALSGVKDKLEFPDIQDITYSYSPKQNVFMGDHFSHSLIKTDIEFSKCIQHLFKSYCLG